MFIKKKNRLFINTLLSASLIMTFVLSGCSNSANFKSVTDKTPPLRGESRHNFSQVADNSERTENKEYLPTSDLKIGFIYVGSIGDYGFTYAQNQGRIALMEELGVETMVIENVPEDERCMDAIQELIESGCTVIFSCSFGFMDYTFKMAEKNPDLYFFHCSGYKTTDNMSAYFGRMYQVRYLTGIVAGLRTKTNKIGYVAAFPIPEVIRGANAFALGVKSVNKEAIIEIKWSHLWYDSGLEKELALELIHSGHDVIAQHQDSLLPQIAAEEEGVWSIGYNSPMGFFSKNAYLTGALWNWAPYMIEQVNLIDKGIWESSNYWGGINDDVVSLEELTKNTAPGTSEAVDNAMLLIQNGFDIFEGPIYDNKGKLRVPEGEVLSDEEKLSMDWFVDNITGGTE